jgi:hypothetical protein
VGDIRSALAGFEAGSHAGSISGNASGAAGTAAAAPSGAAAFSSSTPPPVAGLGDGMRADIRSAIEASAAPPAPAAAEVTGAGSRQSAPPLHPGYERSAGSPRPWAGAGQLIAFHAGKLAAMAVKAGG